MNRVRPLFADKWDERMFAGWFNTHRPDAVIIGSDDFRLQIQWVERLGRRVPEDISFAHIDCSPKSSTFHGIAGIDQNSEEVAAAAVDLVINQLRRGERDIPPVPKVVLIESRWVEGDTVRNLQRTGS